jgi:acetyl-CoA/propionyl-CoA carboxylase biotin carboxyl carrier protein
MFDTVLVANRGEIAVRVLRTLRRLGIRGVAVFSDADAGARHVREADIAVRLGPAPSKDSYLRGDRVLEAAAATGAQAVHPGYGFLAENADFARAAAAAGLVFVGPSPEAIELMGDKIRARLTVAAAGVPIVPGRARPGMSDEDLAAAAAAVGYPVLVKPSAGGGGKGMRMVERADELAEALAGARREAAAAFGDDTMFVERFVQRPRHIEVQVLADTHGQVVHLGERECSLQRRHQKVIEEAPSPLLDAPTRDRLGAAAIATARSVAYTGAGTVEFIVGSDRPDEFFFMEMNTRLQVEHPVTEMITGLDLVEQQILVAAGRPLAFGSEDVPRRGHAVEARVYAEDPGRGFLPTGGRVLVVREPAGDGLRVDSSLAEGLDVATAYDPMLAKVVAWGPDRSSALARLRDALRETVVLGVVTNISFLRALAAHPDVAAGRLDTGLIDREREVLVRREPSVATLAAYALCRLRDAWPPGPVIDLWDVPSGWRPGPHRPLSFRLARVGGEPLVVTVTGTPEDARVRIGAGEELAASIRPAGDASLVTVGGVARAAYAATDGATVWVWVDGEARAFTEAPPPRRATVADAADQEVRSPMPGTVIALRAAAGDPVRAGQPLVVVEAMKMEHVLVAPHDGTLGLLVRVGDPVGVDEVVARVTRVEPAAEVSDPDVGEG